MRLLVAISTLLLLVGCYNHTDTPSLNSTLPKANITISTLKSFASTHSPSAIEGECVVLGRVTSSDSSGNFYKTLTIEDDSGGLELLVGQYSLSSLYPEGLQVALRLQGCTMGYRFGVLQVGSQAASYDSSAVDYLNSPQRIDEVIVRGNSVEPIEAASRRVGELVSNDCGRLARIDDLELIASTSIDTLLGESLDIARWQGYAMFRDKSGDSLVVYTSDYADYALERIPHDRVSITGIVQYGKYPNAGHYYQLKMRYAEDCKIY